MPIIAKIVKRKNQNRPTFAKEGIDLIREFTRTFIFLIDLMLLSGRRIRTVRRTVKLVTPGRIPIQPTTTTTKSRAFQPSRK
jgi:hypothetical protein